MKPALRSITTNPQASFSVRKDIGPNAYSQWHCHPEYELLVIKGGYGSQVIGDRSDTLDGSSRMTLIGPYLPHTMLYNGKAFSKDVEAIVIHFKEELFGGEFLRFPEMLPMRDLFANMAQGIRIKGDTLPALEKMMFDLYEADYFDRFFILLKILYYIGKNKDAYDLIVSPGFIENYSPESNRRIDKIYQYTFDNYQTSVTLDEVSKLTGLSKEAFCRYFKQQTGKTYVEFLTEVRIGNACKMLMQDELDVLEVSYACGYNYASNFYRQFKSIKGVTPLQYRKAYLNLPVRGVS